MSKARGKIDMSGGESLRQNPFAGLEGMAPDPAAPRAQDTAPGAQEPIRRRGDRAGPKSRGRVEIRREKSGRGGKVVTTATKFEKVSQPEIEAWAAELKKQCGTGGTSRPKGIEIQGDRREEVFRFFLDRGFRPVMAGG